MNVATNLAELINKTTNHSQTQPSIWCVSVSTESIWLIHLLCKVSPSHEWSYPFPAQLLHGILLTLHVLTCSHHNRCRLPLTFLQNRIHQDFVYEASNQCHLKSRIYNSGEHLGSLCAITFR